MKNTLLMPILFIGHGNPMNALWRNDFTETLMNIGKRIPKPKAIICISAHWMTEGTWITHMPNPKTIHDFYGFPEELFEIQYPSPGHPQLADHITTTLKNRKINLDDEFWGIDHGTWSVLKHMYPEANIPVLQLSIYMEKQGDYHFQLGQELKFLREEGILIIGSGNIVHNLSLMNWETNAPPYDWVVNFDKWVKDNIEKRQFYELINNPTKSNDGSLSIPAPDHYCPLLYILGASNENDKLRFVYEGIHNASISMRCISFGLD